MTVYHFPEKKEKFNTAPKGSLLGQLFDRAEIHTDASEAPEFQSNQSWDKIQDISQAVANMLVDVAIEINKTIQLINHANISNKEIHITIEGLKRDLASYTDKVVALKQKHADKVGLVTNADEYSVCMSIGLEYMSLNEEIRALLFQPITTLTEYANVAIQQINAQNPNVVTDVQVKEA